MKKTLLAMSLLASQQSIASNFFVSSDCRSINARVYSCGKDANGYFANTEMGREAIENYNVSSAVKTIQEAEFFGISSHSYFQLTRLSDGQLKMDVFFRVRGGGYGDDMDDADYAETVKQHGHAARQIGRASKDPEVQKAVVTGAMGGASSGVAGAAYGFVVGAFGVGGYNAMQGDYKDGKQKN